LVVASTPAIFAPDVYAVPVIVAPTTGSVAVAEVPITYKNVSPAVLADRVTFVVPAAVPTACTGAVLKVGAVIFAATMVISLKFTTFPAASSS